MGSVRKINNKGGTRKSGGKKAFSKSASSTNPDRKLPDGKKAGHFRTKSTIKRLNMYKQKMSHDDLKARHKQSLAPTRIEPDRRWFGNTRVITQKKMEVFREELSKSVNDPFSVVIKASKLPMALLKDPEKEARMNLLSIEPFSEVFGAKATRKKPKLLNYDLDGMLGQQEKAQKKYDTSDKPDRDLAEVKEEVQRTGVSEAASEEIFKKGTSRRIWGELYKVIDSSDVILEVIDARDPMGTRCTRLEKEVKKNHPHKHIVLILNKCDLVPTWACKRWVKRLSKEYPTLAFHASVTNPFGKGALIQLLRQFGGLLKDRKHVSVGLVGYPNVGKSSVINSLKRKKVCKAAPVPGETKVWQFVSLTKRLFLIDCPGIVPPTKQDFAADCAKVLRGVVRAERIENPSNYVDEVLKRVKKEYILERYRLPKTSVWEDSDEFLTLLATKMGKLRKGNVADVETVARIVLYDWQRGRLPFFEAPPRIEGEEESEDEGDNGEDFKERQKAIESVAARQSLNDLECSMEFDKEDMQGDGDETDEDAAEDEEEGESSGKRPRAEGEEETETPTPKKKKKPRRGKGGSKNQKGRGADAVVAPPIDWATVTTEFDA